MLEEMNYYLHGFVAIPAISVCRNNGFFSIFKKHSALSRVDLIRELQANEGYIYAFLRMLQSLGWLEKNNANEFYLTKDAEKYLFIPEDCLSLYHFPYSDYLRGKTNLRLAPWINLIKTRWNDCPEDLALLLDGIIIVPLLLALSTLGNDSDKHVVTLVPESISEELIDLMFFKGWLQDKSFSSPIFTSAGKFIFERAMNFGTVVSYLPLIHRYEDLFFGDFSSVYTRSESNAESHVDRTLNVIGSGFQHKKYFQELTKAVHLLFSELSLEEQPDYIADMGCGDGSLLIQVFNVIKNKTQRGRNMQKYPLRVIGIDFNQAALVETEKNLAANGIPNLVIQGNIIDPLTLFRAFKKAGVENPNKVLHIRSFLDHDRPYVEDKSQVIFSSSSVLTVDDIFIGSIGALIAPEQMYQNLVNHLKKWSEVASEFGLMLIEVHSLENKVVNKFLAQTENLHFDFLHACALQNLVTAEAFLMAAAAASLFNQPRYFKAFPEVLPYKRVTLNYFRKRPYIIRYALEEDSLALFDLEQKCWGNILAATMEEIKRRIIDYPRGQLVLEVSGKIVGSLFTKRIVTVEPINQQHNNDGKILVLLGMNIDPEKQNLSLGEQFIQFALQKFSVTSLVERIIGVTRCKNYKNYKKKYQIAEYMQMRNSSGLLVEPVLAFHESQGAKIISAIPNFRQNDLDNDGYGILIEYIFSGGQENAGQILLGSKTKCLNANKDIKQTVLDCIQKVKNEVNIFSNINRPLMELGFDSLDLMVLRNLLSQEMNMDISPTLFFKCSTSDELVKYFLTTATKGWKDNQIELNPLQKKLPQVSSSYKESDIAIVGISCRFPGMLDSSLQSFWELLSQKKWVITPVPKERKNYLAMLDDAKIHLGGFLSDIDKFDADFFHITPREAEAMDPQQRMLLELVWEAFENAGINPLAKTSMATGVFVGNFSNDYELLQIKASKNSEQLNPYFASGTSSSLLSGRISYVFGFTGPALSINTACSSSLVATHVAAKSLTDSECDLAVAAGVNLILTPELTMNFSHAGMLSSDGKCKTFAYDADGYVRSEGCGVLLLKRLQDALRDQDHIWGVIKGSAINQDGASNGLTAPNMNAQIAVIKQALNNAGIVASQVSYVEAHGTGTNLGDPVEIMAIREAYGEARTLDNPLIIGSVKTNIGHTEAVAGIAGVIKTLLSFEYNYIPAHINCEQVNPLLQLESIPAFIPNNGVKWLSNEKLIDRYAGVSAFGFSGTNAHFILGKIPSQILDDRSLVSLPYYLLPLSAKTEDALKILAERYKDFISKNPDINLIDMEFTVTAGRAAFDYRVMIKAKDVAEFILKLQLQEYDMRKIDKSFSQELIFILPELNIDDSILRAVALLSDTNEVFEEKLQQCASIFLRGNIELNFVSFAKIVDKNIARYYSFAIVYALVEMLFALNIQPKYICGYGAQEYLAAVLVKGITLEDAIVLLMQKVAFSSAEASGPSDLNRQNIAECYEQIKKINYVPLNCGLISSLDGKIYHDLTAEFFYRKLINNTDDIYPINKLPFLLNHNLIHLVFGAKIFSYAKIFPSDDKQQKYFIFDSENNLGINIYDFLQELYLIGWDINWHNYRNKVIKKKIALPYYPFARKRYWLPELDNLVLQEKRGSGCIENLNFSLVSSKSDKEKLHYIYTLDLSLKVHIFLNEYKVGSQIVLPASYYIELLLALAQQIYLFENREKIVINNLEIISPLILEKSSLVNLDCYFIREKSGSYTFTIHSHGYLKDSIHCRGQILLRVPPEDLREQQSVNGLSFCKELDGREFYDQLFEQGIIVGDSFKLLKKLYYVNNNLGAELVMESNSGNDGDLSALNARVRLIDCAFQAIFYAWKLINNDREFIYLPKEFKNIAWYSNGLVGNVWVYGQIKTTSAQNIIAELWIKDDAGNLNLKIDEIVISKIKTSKYVDSQETIKDWLYTINWRSSDKIATLDLNVNQDDKELAIKLKQQLSVINEQQLLLQQEIKLYPLLDRLSYYFVILALVQLNYNLNDRKEVVFSQLVSELKIDPVQYRLLQRCLDVLVEDGILSLLSDGVWLVKQEPEDVPIIRERVAKLLTEIKEKFPTRYVEIGLLERCGGYLPAVLQGEIEPLHFLFPDANSVDAEISLEKLYQSPYAIPFNQIAASAVHNILQSYKRGSCVKILEIGAGTGGTTAYVLSKIKELDIDFSYTFTDISSGFFDKAKEKLAIYDKVIYKKLDIEKDPKLQGYVPLQYDIVIAANVLHATKNLYETLAHVKLLLKLGGALILLEGMQDTRWMDISFGMLDGWWRFADGLRSNNPMIFPQQWRQLLLDTGFNDTNIIALTDEHDVTGQQALILTRSSVAKNLKYNKDTNLVWLVFGDDSLLTQALITQLDFLGEAVCLIKKGKGYNKISDREIEINPLDHTHIVNIDVWLKEKSKNIFGLIFMWGIDEILEEGDSYGMTGQEKILVYQRDVCGPLISIFNIFANSAHKIKPKIYLCTQGVRHLSDEKRLNPLHGALAGMRRSFVLEYPDVKCILIDLDPDCIDATALGAFIFGELWRDDDESEVALRNQERYIPRLISWSESCQIQENDKELLNVQGTYLITGGFGGVGQEIVNWLFKGGVKYFALLSRSKPNEKISQHLELLRQQGANFLLLEADVGDYEQLEKAFHQLRATNFPPLCGVFHAACVLADATLQNQNLEKYEQVFHPKVVGAWNLHLLTKQDKLDYFILFSSISAVLGLDGASNYAAANAVLDALADMRLKNGLPALSINWGVWKDTGLAKLTGFAKRVDQNLEVAKTMEPELALAALALIISRQRDLGYSQVVVSPMVWDRFFKAGHYDSFLSEQYAIYFNNRDVSSSNHDLLTILKGTTTKEQMAVLKQYLAELVVKIAKFDDSKSIDMSQGFLAMGLDSLMTVELTNKIQIAIGPKLLLSPTILFNHPNINALAEFLLNNLFVTDDHLDEMVANDINVMTDLTSALILPSRRVSADKIAIIGIGCRFPGGATNPDKYWELLVNGIDSIGAKSPERQSIEEYCNYLVKTNDHEVLPPGHFLQQNPANFAAKFFNISPREAEYLDPQQRLLLEVSWEALEYAAINPLSLHGTQTGVFLGISNNDFRDLLIQHQFSDQANTYNPYIATGTELSAAAGRLSYFYGLTGPNIAVNTACSSSLVAIHLARQSLLNHESDLALAGGSNLILSTYRTENLSKLKFLSPDGKCRTFDASADGFGRGEGCAIVILKRLSDAIRDRDNIIAVISGAAINQDGASTGLTAPNGIAQKKVLLDAIKSVTNLKAESIDYIEAHGTATSLGDPIEIKAIKEAMGTRVNPLIVGSVKANIGHLEAAAGIAGVIKVALALQREVIPKQVNFVAANPRLDINNQEILIPLENIKWQHQVDKQKIAGVSAFGFSGTNVHILLEDIKEDFDVKNSFTPSCAIVTLTAKDQQALQEIILLYREFLKENLLINIADFAYTTNIGRAHFINNRLALVAKDREHCLELLNEKLSESKDYQCSSIKKITFLFTGQGAQYIGMGRELYKYSEVFKVELNKCEKILERYLDVSLKNILFMPNEIINQTKYTQPAVFAFEYSLAKTIIALGIEPDIVIGHSIGEYVAATISEVISLEDALMLVCYRAKLMQALPIGGSMYAVKENSHKLSIKISEFSAQNPQAIIDIAASNSPRQTVISGLDQDLIKFNEFLAEANIQSKKLSVSHAFHSYLMEPMLDEFKVIAQSVIYAPPKYKFISNVYGHALTNINDDYWCQHVRRAVLFQEGMQTIAKDGCDCYIEIGPAPILTQQSKSFISGRDDSNIDLWLPCLDGKNSEWITFCKVIASLYMAGKDIVWAKLYDKQSRKKLTIPTYAFQRQVYWPECLIPRNSIVHPLIKLYRPENVDVIELNNLKDVKTAYLMEHALLGHPIFPAAAFIEIIYFLVKKRCEKKYIILEDILFCSILSLAAHQSERLEYKLLDSNNEIFLSNNDKVYVKSYYIIVDKKSEEDEVSIAELQRYFLHEIPISKLYQEIENYGMYYGRQFKCLKKLLSCNKEFIAWAGYKEDFLDPNYYLHPALLDAAFQVLGLANIVQGEMLELYLPVHIAKIYFFQPLPKEIFIWARTTERRNRVISGDINIYDLAGRLLVKIEGAQLKAISQSRVKELIQQLDLVMPDLLYTITWEKEKLLNEVLVPANKRMLVVKNKDSKLQYQSVNDCVVKSLDILTSDGFEEVSTTLKNNDNINGIIYDLSASNDSLVKDQRIFNLSYEIHGLLKIIQLLHSLAKITNFKVIVITYHAQLYNIDNLNLLQSPVIGLIKSVRLEYPLLKIKHIDVDQYTLINNNSQILQDCILVEDNLDVCYRQGFRYVASLVRYDLKQMPDNCINKNDQNAFNKVTRRILSDATYLITGAFGGIGFELIRFLITQGARYFILVSRHGANDEQSSILKKYVDEFKINYIMLNKDIGSYQEVQDIAIATKKLPPIKGIFHLASIFHDKLIKNQNWEDFKKVYVPKALGGYYLHQMSIDLNLELDYFVLFSSMASIVGAAGQANYAVANSFLDGLAYYRRMNNLPANSINFGPWSDVGKAITYVNEHTKQGYRGLPSTTYWKVFKELLNFTYLPPTICVADIDWPIFSKNKEQLNVFLVKLYDINHRVAERQQLITKTNHKLSTSLLQDQQKISTMVSDIVAKVLKLSISEINVAQNFFELGLDSLTAAELKTIICKEIGYDDLFPSDLIVEYSSVQEISELILQFLISNAKPKAITIDLIKKQMDSLVVSNIPLFKAIETSNLNMVKLLLPHEDVNSRDEKGMTAVLLASLKNSYSIVELLMKSGANPNLKDNMNMLPIYFALVNDNYDMVDLLLNYGAKLDDIALQLASQNTRSLLDKYKGSALC